MQDTQTFCGQTELALKFLQKGVGPNSIDISKVEDCDDEQGSQQPSCEEYKSGADTFCGMQASCMLTNSSGVKAKAQISLFCQQNLSVSRTSCGQDKSSKTKKAFRNLQMADPIQSRSLRKSSAQ